MDQIDKLRDQMKQIELRMSRRNSARKAGMWIPDSKIRPTAEEFRKLIDEGWRLWLDQDGYVLGYLPPSLWDRMTRLD